MLYAGPLIIPLLKLVESDPGFIVLYKGDGGLTAKELLVKSRNVAMALHLKGFQQTDVAVIAVQPGEEFLEIMYAVIMLRGKIAIIDPEMGRENYRAKMKQLNPKWMFVDSRLLFLKEHPVLKASVLISKKMLPDISTVKGAVTISVGIKMPLWRKYLQFKQLLKTRIVPLDFAADEGFSESLVVYTSGTLDVPKGVVHTGKSLDASIQCLGKLFEHNRNCIVGTYLPHFMMLGIAAGLPVKLMKPSMKPKTKIRFLKKESIGILFGPPTDYLPLIEFCERKKLLIPSGVQHIMIGSAPVHPLFLKRLIRVLPAKTQISCTYGMTENLLVSVIDGRKKSQYTAQGDILGKPIDGVHVYIANDGEICIKSEQAFKRYFHETTTKEWHSTGDLGMMDECNNIILSGRKKEMIIRRNMNIYPSLYENTIKHINGVVEAAMVGIYVDVLHDEKVYLAVEGEHVDIPTVKKELCNGKFNIDKEALPDQIIKMVIPRKGRQHKIDRAGIIDYIQKNHL
ncbi:MAG: class I adenylate-forming enzyme family protein [Ginsengibacter sp.]